MYSRPISRADYHLLLGKKAMESIASSTTVSPVDSSQNALEEMLFLEKHRWKEVSLKLELLEQRLDRLVELLAELAKNKRERQVEAAKGAEAEQESKPEKPAENADEQSSAQSMNSKYKSVEPFVRIAFELKALTGKETTSELALFMEHLEKIGSEAEFTDRDYVQALQSLFSGEIRVWAYECRLINQPYSHQKLMLKQWYDRASLERDEIAYKDFLGVQLTPGMSLEAYASEFKSSLGLCGAEERLDAKTIRRIYTKEFLNEFLRAILAHKPETWMQAHLAALNERTKGLSPLEVPFKNKSQVSMFKVSKPKPPTKVSPSLVNVLSRNNG